MAEDNGISEDKGIQIERVQIQRLIGAMIHGWRHYALDEQVERLITLKKYDIHKNMERWFLPGTKNNVKNIGSIINKQIRYEKRDIPQIHRLEGEAKRLH